MDDFESLGHIIGPQVGFDEGQEGQYLKPNVELNENVEPHVELEEGAEYCGSGSSLAVEYYEDEGAECLSQESEDADMSMDASDSEALDSSYKEEDTCIIEAKSPMPFCFIINDKLKQQHWKQRLQEAQILKQCIVSMLNLRVSNAVPQICLENSNSTSQPSSVSQPDSSLHPSQSGINMKPFNGPPVGALQAVQQVQATAARQTAAHMVAASVSYGKDFDFCISCSDKMEKLGFTSLVESVCAYQIETSLQESRLLSIQHCIQFLVHACQCIDANCRLPICQKMKKIIQHARSCKWPKNSDECSVCRQLFSLCYYHTNYCQEAKCPMPFCLIIKDQLKQQQLQHRLEHAKILKQGLQRHTLIALQQFRQALNSPITPQKYQKALGILKSCPELKTLFREQNIKHQLQQQTSQLHVAHPDSSLHASQSGIGIKPCNGPPIGGL